MKIQYFILMIIILLTQQKITLAERALERSEILEIFQILTEQPKDTWIQRGTVEAEHTKLETSTGFMIESEETVAYDGERFIWQITMNSRTKVIEEENEQQVIFEDKFDFKGNKERVFIWDGDIYTLYFASGNQAIAKEEPTDIPVVVNGPLTAGIIPWGFGVFSYDSLIEMNSLAKEVETENGKQVHISLDGDDIPKVFLVLDTSKKYAVLSCSMDYKGHLIITRTYDDYQNIDEKWIPTSIIIEEYDAQQTLLAYDNWQITSISPIIPDSFDSSVYFDKNTLVQYHSNLIDKPLFYKSNNAIDSQSILMKKLGMELSWKNEDEEKHNCATAALKYVLDCMDISIDSQLMRSLIKTNKNETNLYDLKNFVENKGLYCKAVKGCNISELNDLSEDCHVIIYLPIQKHYVVLAGVNDELVWLIDMNVRKFLYSTKLDKFNKDIELGAYLLISSQSIILGDNLIEIEDEQLNQFTGGETGYCCTKKIQEADTKLCSPMVEGMCLSVYTVWSELYKCTICGSGNECFGEPHISSYWSVCIINPSLEFCIIDGEWRAQYARACMSII